MADPAKGPMSAAERSAAAVKAAKTRGDVIGGKREALGKVASTRAAIDASIAAGNVGGAKKFGKQHIDAMESAKAAGASNAELGDAMKGKVAPPSAGEAKAQKEHAKAQAATAKAQEKSNAATKEFTKARAEFHAADDAVDRAYDKRGTSPAEIKKLEKAAEKAGDKIDGPQKAHMKAHRELQNAQRAEKVAKSNVEVEAHKAAGGGKDRPLTAKERASGYGERIGTPAEMEAQSKRRAGNDKQRALDKVSETQAGVDAANSKFDKMPRSATEADMKKAEAGAEKAHNKHDQAKKAAVIAGASDSEIAEAGSGGGGSAEVKKAAAKAGVKPEDVAKVQTGSRGGKYVVTKSGKKHYIGKGKL